MRVLDCVRGLRHGAQVIGAQCRLEMDPTSLGWFLMCFSHGFSAAVLSLHHAQVLRCPCGLPGAKQREPALLKCVQQPSTERIGNTYYRPQEQMSSHSSAFRFAFVSHCTVISPCSFSIQMLQIIVNWQESFYSLHGIL